MAAFREGTVSERRAQNRVKIVRIDLDQGRVESACERWPAIVKERRLVDAEHRSGTKGSGPQSVGRHCPGPCHSSPDVRRHGAHCRRTA